MKYLALVWAGLRRRGARNTLTLMSAVVAFFLYGMLEGVNASLNHLIDGLRIDRLIVSNPALMPLPLSYRASIAGVPGVAGVTAATGLSGYYRQPGDRTAVFAIEPKSYFRIYPDTVASAADRAAFARTRNGALVAESWARKHHWKRGDVVSFHLPNQPQRDGRLDWTVQIVGFVNYQMAPDSPLVLINYSYFDAARLGKSGTAQRFFVRLRDPTKAGTVARAIDGLFLNSPVPTRTQTEKDLAQSQLTQVGDIGFFVNAIIGASFFTLLLLVGNTMMQSFRERRREFALLKAVGFSDTQVALLIGGEAMGLSFLAAGVGLVAAWRALPALGAVTGGYLPVHTPWDVVAFGIAAALTVGVFSAAIPAYRANRLSVADALAAH